jgi:hypothetical protein
MNWDNVYSWAQFLTVFFAGVALVSGLIVNKRQARTISTLQEAAALQQGKNLELEKGNIEAQKALEEERSTRLEMEKSFSPRAISLTVNKDGTTSVDTLRPFAGIGMIVEFVPDAEASRAASNVAA